jgi:predicted thioesterase
VRPGLTDKSSSTVSAEVTESMVAQLGGQKIHPVLATAQMIEWMEWAGRKLILPYLEESEDAVGYAIDIVHLAPTLVGEKFTATATFVALEGNRIVANVAASNERELIGKGVFTQVLVPKALLADRIRTLQENRRPD